MKTEMKKVALYSTGTSLWLRPLRVCPCGGKSYTIFYFEMEIFQICRGVFPARYAFYFTFLIFLTLEALRLP